MSIDVVKQPSFAKSMNRLVGFCKR